ncbi:MAG: hypothetical protein JO276_12140 [Sphingomonadaceae bacterium]|nr:hypothetical protein [Sphingomonadaceae bacterium]
MRILIALVAAAVSAGAAAAANAPETSWGKAGVSFDDYRSDATFCLRMAAGTDLTGTEPANALVLASRRMATGQTNDYTPAVGGANGTGPSTVNSGFDPAIEAANRMQQERIAARPELRIRQARDILQLRLDHCLAGRGYHRFRLTDDQRRQLRHMPLRAPERQVYLHRLASDPQVLAAQGE